MNFWQNLPKPIVCLAPMDGYTDQPFRLLVRSLDPRVVVFTEFLSADGIMYGAKPIMKALELKKEESPLVVQIFGKDPENLAKAAKICQDRGADAIDVNMGCPAKKIVNSLHGSALMKDIDLACKIVSSMKEAVNIPVSVKTRLGWENEENLIPFVKRLEEAGLDHVTIHGRTYKQAFKGEAVWDPIYELKRHVKITVVGNGDVTGYASAKEKLGNLDGVMVGRATFGNPWIMKEITTGFYDASPLLASDLTMLEKIPLIRTHLELSNASKGYRGILEMRKHLASYVKGVTGASAFRERCVRIESVEEGLVLLGDLEEHIKTSEVLERTL